jgi:hypothetical protein
MATGNKTAHQNQVLYAESLVLNGTALTATAAELNQAADISGNTLAITAIKAVGAEESGMTFFINNATGFATTLPAPAVGLRYTFISKLSNTSGNHTIVTTSSANIIKGFATNAAGALVTPLSDGDTISFVANQSVAGDQVTVVSDGTSWFMSGFAQVAAGITLTKAT